MTVLTDHARILVTGSRTWTDWGLLDTVLMDTWHDAVQDGYPGIHLTHGACPDGADSMVGAWAVEHHVPQDPHPADWTAPCPLHCAPGHRRRRRDGTDYCPTAGPRRNQHMVDLRPLLVIAFHHARSSGTADCMRRAESAGIPVRRITGA
ncbi:DUF2493 domain-containing protein [Streptomyces sp. DH12]|uniref:DUF2493 domain-containing protein n=1 Tax=Streptomyces sp. DH12 TaxID=2857010 RepID=UPI001E44D404|nr:DUF2493 domain-containing protein [Streptomyces sp. DH12]